jgi:hypothetical protein
MMNDNFCLEFNEAFQEAVAGHLLTDTMFFLKCKDQIPHFYFTDPIVSELVRIAYTYYDNPNYGNSLPTRSDVVDLITFKFREDIKSQKTYISMLDRCYLVSKDRKIELIQSLMTGWLRLIKLQDGFKAALNKYNRKEFDDAIDFTEKFIKEVRKASFLKDERADFTNLEQFYIKRKESLDTDCCTIGHDVFDEMLRSGSSKNNNKTLDINLRTKGSLAPGDTSIIMGASNSGKTTTIVSIIAANIVMGKHVLLITHEQKDDDIKDKIVKSITNLDSSELEGIIRGDVNIKNRLKAAEELLTKYLVYVPWIKVGKMNVESVVNVIRLEQEMRVSNTGKGFDLLVDDYPGKLRSTELKGRQLQGHEEVGYVYDQFVNIAKEHKFHAILPVQTNREGYKTNRNGDSGRLLDQGDIAGSFAVAQMADTVITINRSPADVKGNRIKFYMAKCRTNATGATFASQTDMARSRTHHVSLGCAVIGSGEDCSDAALSIALKTTETNIEKITTNLHAINDVNIAGSLTSNIFGHDDDGNPITSPDQLGSGTVIEDIKASIKKDEEKKLAEAKKIDVPTVTETKPLSEEDEIMKLLKGK